MLVSHLRHPRLWNVMGCISTTPMFSSVPTAWGWETLRAGISARVSGCDGADSSAAGLTQTWVQHVLQVCPQKFPQYLQDLTD